ncbi:hypothetical protein BCR32DRAFT_289772 [Anaeromyces robustus]|uniref:Pre-rRNA-processing protein RIX1 n=1 Tax=Anaeromyces robustus TaxID=1754192 RepID=A0A1Y1XM89_9FUNG|nr:hypothetical protein BCR32DRAFT_289772 [Anaeromyces robustus]|eukprot:ORX86841.1 hypothetical protein BCR32DRAFT_289772 [Anaeromyces robustus]
MEENSLLIFNYIFNNNDSNWDKDIIYTLNFLYNTNIFKTSNLKSLQPWLIKINSLIRTGSINEKIGAFKLSELISDNSDILFTKNCNMWINGMIPLLNKPEFEQHRATLINILLKYLQKSKELQVEKLTLSLNNQVSKILGIIVNMMEKDPKNLISMAYLQKRCMELFPFSISSLKNKIESNILTYLQGSYSLDAKITKNAIELLISYNIALSKVEKRNNIDNFISKILGTLHETLDMLLESIEEENKLQVSFPSFSLPKNFNSQWIKNENLINRYYIYTYTLSKCLCQYNNKFIKSVTIEHLLDIICRVINVFEGSIQKENSKKENFDLLINSMPLLIKRSMIYLDSLIFCFNKVLLPHKELLYEIMHKLIHRASNNNVLAISLYHIMESYINLYEISFFNEFKEKIFKLILNDIHLLNTLEYKSDIIIENKPKKRKLDKFMNLNQNEKIQDIEKLIAVLQCKELFKLETSLEIDECIIKFILDQSQKSNNRTEKFNLLLLESYNCLINSLIYSSDSTSPCLSYALNIFSLGLNDFSIKIREICKDALIKCNSLIHPYLPSIYKSSSIKKNIKTSMESKEKEQVTYLFENNNIESLNRKNESKMNIDMEDDVNSESGNGYQEEIQELNNKYEKQELIQDKGVLNISKPIKKIEKEHFIINEPSHDNILIDDKNEENINEDIENDEVSGKSSLKNQSSPIIEKNDSNISYEEENNDNSDSDIELPDIVVEDSDEE